jgi:hypothetical protein
VKTPEIPAPKQPMSRIAEGRQMQGGLVTSPDFSPGLSCGRGVNHLCFSNEQIRRTAKAEDPKTGGPPLEP